MIKEKGKERENFEKGQLQAEGARGEGKHDIKGRGRGREEGYVERKIKG